VKKWMAKSNYTFLEKNDELPIDSIENHINDMFTEQLASKDLSVIFNNDSIIKSICTNKTVFLTNIINNIISNAIKFSPVGGVITVTCTAMDDTLQIDIMDEGTGIPEETIPHLFNPEIRTTTLGTNNEKGTGFGLPISKKMIEQLGGSIEVISGIMVRGNESYGTSFQLKLNLK